MVMLYAIGAGLLAGLTRGWIYKTRLAPVRFRHTWLVLLAVLPQLFAFHLQAFRARYPSDWVVATLLGSQALLLVFVLINRLQPGMVLAGIGLALNGLAILANGGLMPISPELLGQIALPGAFPDGMPVGSRYGWSKDIILLPADTRLWLLTDIFLLPAGWPGRAAFSVGDVLLSAGAFWFIWNLSQPPNEELPHSSITAAPMG